MISWPQLGRADRMTVLDKTPGSPSRARLGAHIAGGGGLAKIAARAREIGCEAVQIFASSPQMWRPPATKPDDAAAFQAACTEWGLAPVAVHAIYLVNPASENPEFRAKTTGSLIATLKAADLLGAGMVITHLGSALGSARHGAVERACGVFAEVLDAHNGQARLMFETSAGAGATLGGTFEELGQMIHRLGSPENLGVCIDTAHIFTAGYDLRTADGLEATLEQLDHHVGLDRLAAAHLNDSKAPFGSNRDRHENLGDGEIGAEALARFVNHPVLEDCPVYLEVPGYAKQGPDRPNMERLYAFAGRPFPIVG
ncbi:MAG TPA: deoxyribonuclease IV [Chloroflexota bacterium]|nr:deoxyribonuclease IV [Chloroflexota bacterium]